MKIDRLDHLVLTVKSNATICEFYENVPGMEMITFSEGRKALVFCTQKIKLNICIAVIIEIIEGPVKRIGAVGRILCVYFRDSDMNLIDVPNYVEGTI